VAAPTVLAAARTHAPATSMRETYEERRSGGRDRAVWPRHGIARETGSPPHQNHRRDGMVPRNGWVFRAGHTIRLEAVQNDAPYLRADNLASAITYQSVALDLPVR